MDLSNLNIIDILVDCRYFLFLVLCFFRRNPLMLFAFDAFLGLIRLNLYHHIAQVIKIITTINTSNL